MGHSGEPAVAVTALDIVGSAFCIEVGIRAQPESGRVEFVASFVILVDCDRVGAEIDALLVTLGNWALWLTLAGPAFVEIECSTFVVVDVIAVYFEEAELFELSGAGDSAEVVANVVADVLQGRCLGLLEIPLPLILVAARILALRTECPKPPEVRISRGGLALKKRHWKKLLHYLPKCLAFCCCYFVMRLNLW